MRNGGRILVDQLELNGADLAFCLPGESFLPVLDALYDSSIRLVSCRHEQGAANAAEAYGKLTGRPGICLVTRGPGATQAAVGVHTAKQDSTPLLLLVGHVPRAFEGREAWQDSTTPARSGASPRPRGTSTAPIAYPSTWSARSHSRSQGGPARSCSPSPRTCSSRRRTSRTRRPFGRLFGRRATTISTRLRELLAAAERPLVIVGEGGWTRQTGKDVLAFCEANELPVACAFRCQDFVDNRSRSYAGVLGVAMDDRLATRLREADLVLAFGGGSGRCRRAATRSSMCRSLDRRSFMSTRTRTS